MANVHREVDTVQRTESAQMKLLISAYALVPFVLTILFMYAIAGLVRNRTNKSARGGFLTKTGWGDAGLIAGSAVLYFGASFGMMYIPNLVKPDSKAK